MPLDLHPSCQEKLRISLGEHLANASVHNGMFLTSSTFAYLFPAQMILPVTGKVHEKMNKYVGESPLVDFVAGTLSQELFETQEFQSEGAAVPLSSIAKYADLSALADRLTKEFNSLPWSYTVTVPLPDAFSEVFCANIKKMKMSDSISISCGDEGFLETFPLSSGIEKRDLAISGGGLLSSLLIASEPPVWKDNRAYLQVRVSGFIGKYLSTEPLLEAIGVLRAFYGLGLALRLFKPATSYQSYKQDEKLYIHRKIDEKWVIEEVRALDSSRSEVIRDLKFHDLDGALDTEAKRAVWMRRNLAAISSVFSAADGARNIVLGSQWLLDSYCGSDELLQFVQAAVVVEILLGDKTSSDLTGLGELLSNRCAYLIANSHAQRNEVLQDFRKIYEVRSKIVHRGKSQLSLHERGLFNTLRWMCRRIIQEEIQLLQKDEIANNA